MGTELFYTALFRILLPAGLLASVLFRYNLFSGIYLIFLLIHPFLPPLTKNSFENGSPRRFLQTLLGLSTLNCFAQIIFQITWLILISYKGEFYDYCTTFGQILFNIGFNRMDGLPSWLDGIRLVGTDLLMFLLAAGIYLTCDKKVQIQNAQETQQQESQPSSKVFRKKLKRSSDYLLLIGELIFMVLLAAAGVLQPSLLSAVYFISFLGTATWLASSRALQRPYFIARSILLLIAGSHFILIYAYQFSFFQKMLPQEDLTARLLGLKYLASSTSCGTARSLHFLGQHWTCFASPIILLVLYTHSATMTRYRLLDDATCYGERDPERTRSNTISSSPSRRVSSVRCRRRKSDGSKILLNEERRQQNYHSIDTPGTSRSPPSDPEGLWPGDAGGTFSEASTQKNKPFLTIFRLVAKGSYIGTLIIMMAWSITYHSWLTFLLLVGSCVLWMTPDSRGNCLRSSPFLVAYAEALLMLQYVYSLDLTDTELPSVVPGISLKDIGLIKYGQFSFQPLSIKILFTVMFWLTLWFYIEEEKDKKYIYHTGSVHHHHGTSPPTDGLLLESFQQHLPTPSGDSERHQSLVPNNPWLIFIGNQINLILSKYWIWIVASMLMIISLGGQKVVIYRIVYMIFFLFFILMFQFSYPTWRKVIKSFWVLNIVYSMFVLLLIYTYQFDGVPAFLEDKLYISKNMQKDFGLETYSESGVLLSKLLTPTFFLIITIIQLHYFHKQFLIISNLNLYRQTSQETIVEEVVAVDVECLQRETVSPKLTSSSSCLSPEDFMAKFQNHQIYSILRDIWELFWRCLEIHINKIVLFSMLCLAIYDACPLHILYLLFALVALPLPSLQLLFCRCGAILASTLLLLKMLYQLHFAQQYPFVWVTNCTDMSDPPFDKEINNIDWIGLRSGGSLVSYCQGYIGLIIILTLQAVTFIRQRIRRYKNNLPDPLPGILFPDVTRSDADKSLKHCAKFLLNFGFYKFGLEVCFIMSIISIGIRMDVFALLSTLWLFLFIFLKRSTINRCWPIFILFQEITLTIQFLLIFGLPPGLCYEYPWHLWQNPNSQYRELSDWLFLPNYNESISPNFLLADVVLLVCCCCQAQVFLIEKSPDSERYAGGSNQELNFTAPCKDENPVEDFVTNTKSYLDILKVSVFFSFYWICLAVLFMAGAGSQRISIFAMGYVIGCFFYLWSGNEFYLKPRAKLVKLWNILVAYNLIVVLLKTIFQVIIPTFKNEMKSNNLWWIVQLVNNNLDGPENMADQQALIWDALCFAFLMIQRRIFSSNYFQYVILEMTAQKLLASRGAELINELQAKIIHDQRLKETENMEKIKMKMDKIRDQQKSGRYIEPKDHYEAIRSGDYFLFDGVLSADLEILDHIHTPEDHEVKTKGINALPSLEGMYKSSIEKQESSEESSKPSPSADRTSPESSHIQTTSSPIPGRKIPDPTFIDVPISPEHPVRGYAAITEEPYMVDPNEPGSSSLLVQICNLLNFFNDISSFLLISATEKLNRISKDYRFVAERLTYEKIALKKQILEGKITPETTIKKDFVKAEGSGDQVLDDSPPCEESADSTGRGDFKKQQPAFVKFLVALWYSIISQSEIICYLVITIYQIECSSLLSLPLPLLAFLWGSLAVPRSTKTFWITIITYTETIVIIKFFFQFNFWAWNKEPCRQPDDPYQCPQLIIGISKQNYNVVIDLMLLLAVFFHRFMLKSFGLWRNSNIGDHAAEKPLHAPPPLVGERESDEEDKFDCSDLEDEFPSLSSSAGAKFMELVSSYIQPFKQFFHNLYSQEKMKDDVYAYMFFCDFINFLILVFGYNAFGMSGAGTVTSYIEENRIPVPFLAMLLAQFAAIVIDRALYIRKNIFGKIVFQILMVIVIHIWMFFLLPAFTHKPFYEAFPPKLWYGFKSIYFLLSAYQIRMGYPMRILGNFFCKKYNYINLILFKLYLIIPFLYELRSLMDWIYTSTSLAVGNWFKMEDIFAHVFVLKCYRRAEDEYPFPRGAPRPALSKYGIGGTMLIFMILVIWFPLVFFALGNTVGKRNPPLSSDFKLSIPGFQPIFTVSAQDNSFLVVSEENWKEFYQTVTRDSAGAATFLNRYEREDVTIVPFQINALGTWTISPPSRKLLIQQLQDQSEVLLTLSISFTRSTETSAISAKTVSYEYSQRINDSRIVNELIEMINQTDTSVHKVTFHKPFLPLFLVLSDKEPVKTPSELPYSDRNLSLSLRTHRDFHLQWWQATDGSCNASTREEAIYYDPLGLKNCSDFIYVLAFNNKSFPRELFLFSNYGIIGLYTTFVLVLSRLIRSFVSGTSFTIMFDEMPNVDRVLELCLDIYMVRENQQLELEEDLFAKLIFLYRSPETLIKWSRPADTAAGVLL